MAYPFDKFRIKKALRIIAGSIASFILAVLSLLTAFFSFDLIQNNAHLVFIYRESIPEVKLGFIAAMIFAGLYFFNTLLTVFFKGNE